MRRCSSRIWAVCWRARRVRTWAARTLIFIVVVLLGTAIGVLVSHFVRLSLFTGVDRFFGGALRRAARLGDRWFVGHSLSRAALDGETWWRGSVLMPYAEHAANVLRSMVGERKIIVQASFTTPAASGRRAAHHVRHRRHRRHQSRQSAPV